MVPVEYITLWGGGGGTIGLLHAVNYRFKHLLILPLLLTRLSTTFPHLFLVIQYHIFSLPILSFFPLTFCYQCFAYLLHFTFLKFRGIDFTASCHKSALLHFCGDHHSAKMVVRGRWDREFALVGMKWRLNGSSVRKTLLHRRNVVRGVLPRIKIRFQS
jgi:hypothetical protein